MVVSRAKTTLYLMKMFAKDFQCPYVTKTLYTSLVQPITEYCSIVWAPSTSGDIARIESIQKQFLLFALRHHNWADQYSLPPYEARLSLLNLDTLQDRRRIAALSFVHGTLNGTIRVAEFSRDIQFSIPLRATRRAMIPRLRVPPLSRASYVNNGPIRRTIDLFNQYAELYEPGVSLNVFKSRISVVFCDERRARLRTRGY